MPLSPWAQDTLPLPLARIPEPWHSLLAHPAVLTPRLERYYRDSIGLEVVTAEIKAGALIRKILLRLASDTRIVEFGAIRVDLERLPRTLREAVLAGKQPFGNLLHQERFPHQAGKRVCFSVQTKTLILPANVPRPQGRLYGRTHAILAATGEPLAHSSEILSGVQPDNITSIAPPSPISINKSRESPSKIVQQLGPGQDPLPDSAF